MHRRRPSVRPPSRAPKERRHEAARFRGPGGRSPLSALVSPRHLRLAEPLVARQGLGRGLVPALPRRRAGSPRSRSSRARRRWRWHATRRPGPSPTGAAIRSRPRRARAAGQARGGRAGRAQDAQQGSLRPAGAGGPRGKDASRACCGCSTTRAGDRRGGRRQEALEAFGGNKSGTYVRKPGDAQTWLANAELDVAVDVKDWVRPTCSICPRPRSPR